MKTIEERAKEYAHQYRRDAHDLKGERADAAFAAYCQGAEDERAELTRWRDPNDDQPQRNVDVLVKLRDTYKDDKIHYSVGYINGACWFGDSIGASDEVIGWRPIHE